MRRSSGSSGRWSWCWERDMNILWNGRFYRPPNTHTHTYTKCWISGGFSVLARTWQPGATWVGVKGKVLVVVPFSTGAADGNWDVGQVWTASRWYFWAFHQHIMATGWWRTEVGGNVTQTSQTHTNFTLENANFRVEVQPTAWLNGNTSLFRVCVCVFWKNSEAQNFPTSSQNSMKGCFLKQFCFSFHANWRPGSTKEFENGPGKFQQPAKFTPRANRCIKWSLGKKWFGLGQSFFFYSKQDEEWYGVNEANDGI